ncbi:pilus assembly protein PilM [Cyanobium sp. FGCU-52]|nr:pilus assembly protein PilM [Cyanobium sp. FGCU52]
MFSGLIDEVQDRLRPIRSQMFPSLVLLELDDDALQGQVLRRGQPEPVTLDVPLPPLTCKKGMPLEKEPLGDLIGDLLVRDNLLDAYLLVALPPAAAHWRVVAWPFDEMPEDPLEALRQVDPDLRFPFSLEEATLDLQPLPGRPGVPARMLLAAAPTALVDAWVDVFNLAGAHLERLAPAQACEYLALLPLLAEAPDDELIAVLDHREGGCRLMVLRAGLPVFERVLPIGDEPLRLELERCLAFLRRRDPQARRLRLLLAAPFPLPPGLEDDLGTTAEVMSCEPYGSLVLKGLAVQETKR